MDSRGCGFRGGPSTGSTRSRSRQRLSLAAWQTEDGNATAVHAFRVGTGGEAGVRSKCRSEDRSRRSHATSTRMRTGRPRRRRRGSSGWRRARPRWVDTARSHPDDREAEERVSTADVGPRHAFTLKETLFPPPGRGGLRPAAAPIPQARRGTCPALSAAGGRSGRGMTVWVVRPRR